MAQREARLVAFTLVAAILLYTSIALLGTPVFWVPFVLLALLTAALIIRGRRRGTGGGALWGAFLCDDCKYNDQRYCSKPERPNAGQCDDYKQK